jgi:hypothetical protein
MGKMRSTLHLAVCFPAKQKPVIGRLQQGALLLVG